MKRFAMTALAAGTVGLLSGSAFAADTAPGVEVGKLTCSVEQETSFILGSTATLGCVFAPAKSAPPTYYTGTISDFGLDIGTTDKATLVWGVLAPSVDMEAGVLEGNYAGLSAGASLGAGVKANALIGGLDKSIALNPLSLQSQTGTNLTLGVSKLTLKSAS